MSKKPKDRHLDVPGEANRDKHINFVANERTDPSEDRSAGSLDRDRDKRAEKKNKPKRKDTQSNNAR